MPGFTVNPYRRVLLSQARDLLSAFPDAIAALAILAAVGCAYVALNPAPAAPHAKWTLRVAEARP